MAVKALLKLTKCRSFESVCIYDGEEENSDIEYDSDSDIYSFFISIIFFPFKNFYNNTKIQLKATIRIATI